jgi:hypothetical protein
MIGSDGLPHDRHPHPRLWGAFPRVLARYWRERRLFTLEQVVYKTSVGVVAVYVNSPRAYAEADGPRVQACASRMLVRGSSA